MSECLSSTLALKTKAHLSLIQCSPFASSFELAGRLHIMSAVGKPKYHFSLSLSLSLSFYLIIHHSFLLPNRSPAHSAAAVLCARSVLPGKYYLLTASVDPEWNLPLLSIFRSHPRNRPRYVSWLINVLPWILHPAAKHTAED